MEIKELQEFLDYSHSAYHACAYLAGLLDQAGYTRLRENQEWELVPGGKYYLLRNGSALMAFRVPSGAPKGFMLSAAHSDRPTFRVKENGELEGNGYLRLATERYGGMLMAPWLDRPLSIAGRVLVKTGTGLESRLVDVDRDLLMIPNVAIHMNRKANDGYTWNPAVDMIPLLGSAGCKGKLMSLVAQAAGAAEDAILSHDLQLYVRQKATVWGLEEEYISAQGLDDLQCAYACVKGFLGAGEGESIPVCAIFDNEEVGSSTRQGADSNLLPSVLRRICDGLNLNYYRMTAGSFLVSADNAHAVHPNHPEYADPSNRPQMNQGIVLKFNANQRYCTDGGTAAFFRGVCKEAEVPVQSFWNRADLMGGSTLGNISSTQVAIASVDLGLPQLAMHSCYETAGVKDTGYLIEALKTLYAMTYSGE